MAQSKPLIPSSEINRTKVIYRVQAVLTYKCTLRELDSQIPFVQFNLGLGIPPLHEINLRELDSQIPFVQFNLGLGIPPLHEINHTTGNGIVPNLLEVLRRYILLALFVPITSIANPWLPEVGGWKYNFSYSKYDTPKTIKFYERDLYFGLEKEKALASHYLDQQYILYKPLINNRKQYILSLNSYILQNFAASLNGQALDPVTKLQKIQEMKHTLFSQDNDLQIQYNNLNNITADIKNQIKQMSNLQKYLILSYHKWSAKTSIEYGQNNYFSYGMNVGRTRGVNKYKTNDKTDETEIFVKAKIYDKKGYVFTLQPKITSGPIDSVDFTAMLGKSHLMERKISGKPIEIFGYSAFGITYFRRDQPMLKKTMHGEITSGIKYNDRTIIMNQESEDLNPQLGKIYKRVLRSQFTIAQDLNFANIEPRNKVYLIFSYFVIDSVKAKRRLSSGYSVGLWLEL